MKKMLVAALITMALSGCASAPFQGYEGGPRADNEQAVVRSPKSRRWTSIEQVGYGFMMVDGKKIAPSFAYGILPEELRLLPGKHRFTLLVSLGQYRYGFPLWLCANAGMNYRVRVKRDGIMNIVDVWIEEEAGGARVGGRRDQTEEPTTCDGAAEVPSPQKSS